MRPSPRTYTYLLGDSRAEAQRLRDQSKLWDPVSLALFDRLKIKRGWNVLEIGPGGGSLHKELRKRVHGPVDYVERSETFANALIKQNKRDGLGHGLLWNCNLLDASLPPNTYDLIFARWVFLFLPDPLAHIKLLAKALKPGGVIAIQDYHRDPLCMIPTPVEWPAFIKADMAFFASQGGDASIGAKLPALYRKAGLQVTDIHATIKTGNPGSPEWNWMSTYFEGVMDDLAKFKPFTPKMAASLKRQWRAAAGDPSSLLISPAVLDVVARK